SRHRKYSEASERGAPGGAQIPRKRVATLSPTAFEDARGDLQARRRILGKAEGVQRLVEDERGAQARVSPLGRDEAGPAEVDDAASGPRPREDSRLTEGQVFAV